MPSLHDARLSSLLGALMSAAYCIIAVAMSATVKPGPEVSIQQVKDSMCSALSAFWESLCQYLRYSVIGVLGNSRRNPFGSTCASVRASVSPFVLLQLVGAVSLPLIPPGNV
jgi:hypothetical protein